MMHNESIINANRDFDFTGRAGFDEGIEWRLPAINEAFSPDLGWIKPCPLFRFASSSSP